MGKFLKLQTDVFSIFGNSAWKSEEIFTFPSSVHVENLPSEFVRVNIIASGWGLNKNSVSGILILDIFTQANAGPTRNSQIADKLDSYLAGKTIASAGFSTQFYNSSLSELSPDTEDVGLVRSKLTVPFSHFGVM